MILYVVRSQRPLQYVRVISDEVMQERGYGFWFTDDVLAAASTESYVVDGGELSDFKGQFLFRHLVPACKEPKEPFGGRAYFEVLVPGNDFEPPQMISRTYLNWHDFLSSAFIWRETSSQSGGQGVPLLGPTLPLRCELPSAGRPRQFIHWHTVHRLGGGLMAVGSRWRCPVIGERRKPVLRPLQVSRGSPCFPSQPSCAALTGHSAVAPTYLRAP